MDDLSILDYENRPNALNVEKATLLMLVSDAGFEFSYDRASQKYVSNDPNPALQVFLDKAINHFDKTKYEQYYNVIKQVIESRNNGGNN